MIQFDYSKYILVPLISQFHDISCGTIYPHEAIFWPQLVIVQTNLKLLYDSIVSGFCNVNFASFRPFLIFMSSLGQCLNSKALSHMTHCAKVEIDSVNSEKMMKMWRVKCQNNDKCWTKIDHLDLVIKINYRHSYVL